MAQGMLFFENVNTLYGHRQCRRHWKLLTHLLFSRVLAGVGAILPWQRADKRVSCCAFDERLLEL